MFTTERLRLRAFKASDVDSHLVLFNDFAVVEYLASTEAYVIPFADDVLKEMVIKSAKESVMYCVMEELESQEFVGFAAIYKLGKRNRDATFGIALAKKFWSKGYGREVTNFIVDYAFRSLNAHRVTLNVYAGNERAIGLYKSIGFVEEGRTRKATWINGEWHDLVQMGVLEEEWAGLHGKTSSTEKPVSKSSDSS